LNIPVVGDAATCPAGQKIKRRRLLMTNIKKMIDKFMKEEDGTTAVEYGVMVALISVAIILAVTAIGTNLTTRFNEVATAIRP
jgi:pilus assembly protein Flp/PilA